MQTFGYRKKMQTDDEKYVQISRGNQSSAKKDININQMSSRNWMVKYTPLDNVMF